MPQIRRQVGLTVCGGFLARFVLKSEQNRDGGCSRERILLPNQARAKIKKRLAALDQKVPLRPTPHDILLSISL
jgi:hypothetical protein